MKRVIGLPGDTVEVRQGVVILNGRPLPRQRIADFAMPVSPEQPVPRRRPRRGPREVPATSGETLLPLSPASARPCRTARSYEVLDQVRERPGRQLSARSPSRRAISS